MRGNPVASHAENETNLNSLIEGCREEYPGPKATHFSIMPKIFTSNLDFFTVGVCIHSNKYYTVHGHRDIMKEQSKWQ
jgi:hypothetical protein